MKNLYGKENAINQGTKNEHLEWTGDEDRKAAQPKNAQKKRLFNEITNPSDGTNNTAGSTAADPRESLVLVARKHRRQERDFECFVDGQEHTDEMAEELDGEDAVSLLEMEMVMSNSLKEERMKPYPCTPVKTQAEINSFHRALLVDAMVKIHYKFKLTSKILLHSIRILDEFLIQMEVSRSSLRLVVTTCIIIAAKYENIKAPRFSRIVAYVDGDFTLDEFVYMEKLILNTIDFKLHYTEPSFFIEAFLYDLGLKGRQTGMRDILESHCYYFMETAHLCVNLMKYPISMIAMASILIGLSHEDAAQYLPKFKEVAAKYKFAMLCLATCARELISAACSPIKFSKANVKEVDVHRHFTAIERKYAKDIYFRVSRTPYSFKNILS